MEFTSLIGFALAFFIFAASPGPDNMTILARTLHHGAASGLAYGLGTVTGILIFLSLRPSACPPSHQRWGGRWWCSAISEQST